ncbi:cathepsin L2-like [Bolinopsis microptera]|uniref:cathepsin L2-like n=1 Tax=Bolinopsis microptera TaxID=2820187 RepID=UPI00307AAA6D
MIMNLALSNLRVILLYSLLVHFVDCEDEAVKEEILHASSYADAYDKYKNAFQPENKSAWLGALSLSPEQRRKKEIKEKRKQQLFMKRLKSCNKHNKNFKEGISGFSETVNKFTIMEDDERMSYTGVDLNSTEIDAAEFRVKRQTSNILPSDLPQSVNWVEKGYVTEPKNQKGCGSCWAFSAMVPLEYAYKKVTKNLISLSEQDLMDCKRKDTYPDRTGCMGGHMFGAWKYLMEAQSLASTEEYPYQATGLPCRSEEHTNALANKFTLTSIQRVKKGSVEEVMSAIAQYGPVSAFTATPQGFFAYNSGIFDGCQLPKTFQVSHAVAIVGYDTNTWLVKNSWGKKWGEDGYMRVKRRNVCRILDSPGYITVTKYPDYVPAKVPVEVPAKVPAKVPAEKSAKNADESRPTSRCEDKGKESDDINCAYWKTLGHCKSKKIKMAKYCADTCKLCNFVDKLKNKSIEQRRGRNKSNKRGGGRGGRQRNYSQ